MLDKIQEDWEKCVEYAINVTKDIYVGDMFDISPDSPIEVKAAHERYLKNMRHGIDKLSNW